MAEPKQNDTKVPLKMLLVAHKQWLPLLATRLIAVAIGVIIGPFIIKMGKHFPTNRFGEGATPYNYDYAPNASKEGWEFFSLDPDWRDKSFFHHFLWFYGNDEDGFLGDIRGKWSGICDGKERSFKNMYKWNALRNPANNLSRYSQMFNCNVNNCDIEYWGDFDKDDGATLTKATDRDSGRVYYGYRNSAGANMGFKVYPKHALEVQPDDNEDRGFTYRPI